MSGWGEAPGGGSQSAGRGRGGEGWRRWLRPLTPKLDAALRKSAAESEEAFTGGGG